MKKITLLLSLAVLTTILVFTSCEKNDKDTPPVTTEKSAQDQAIADAYWSSIDNDVDFATNQMEVTNFKSVIDTCPMIIVEHPDSIFWPRTVIIDYGDDYCETHNGQQRKGRIIITVSNFLAFEGSTRTVAFENFYINEHHVEGLKTLTNMGINDSGNMNFDASLTNGSITFPDGGIATREVNHNREWTEGLETIAYWWDNEWLIRGTASGTNRDGGSYNNLITTPVLVKSICHFPVSGIIDINITDLGTLVLDYGDGSCDNIATVTFGDQVWEIELGH